MKIATITACYNESLLLPQFLHHYEGEVDAIFLVDNESDDDSIAIAAAHPKVTITTYRTYGSFVYRLKHKAVENVRRSCQSRFDYVLMVDIDEFVKAKSGISLRKQIECLGNVQIAWAHGYHMWKAPVETPYDPLVPLSIQRTHGIESLPGDIWGSYSKPFLIRPESNVSFVPGMHGFDGMPPLSPEALRASPFLLLHYLGIDEGFYVERALLRARRLSVENRQMNYSIQYYMKSEEAYRARFREMSSKSRPVPWISGVPKR